jgi:uncharacterized protein (UPF0333 family)
MIAWEKLVTWILVLVVIFVVAYFLISQLGSGGGLFDNFFGTADNTATIPPFE